MARKDLLSRLADAGEEAISRLSETPGADRVLGVANSMRDRVDELQRKISGIDELERRVAALERRLDETKTRKATAPRKAAAKRSTAKKTAATTKRPG
jgi:hypothetical protein